MYNEDEVTYTVTKSLTIGKLAEAMAKVQIEISKAHKDSMNPFFKSKYADLTSVWDACREPLSKHDLAVVQTNTVGTEGYLVLVTTLMHKSGEWIEGTLPIKPVKNDPQGIGSAMTYARRYALSAMVGICPDDDDGEVAMGRKRPQGEIGKYDDLPPITKSEQSKPAVQKWLDSAKQMKKDLGKSTHYYDVLGKYSKEHANEVTDRKMRVDVWGEWSHKLSVVKGE